MNKDKQSQADKFREAAKELETDNDEKRFDENLKKLAESKTGIKCPKCGFSPKPIETGYDYDGLHSTCIMPQTGQSTKALSCKHLEAALSKQKG